MRQRHGRASITIAIAISGHATLQPAISDEDLGCFVQKQ
jgi:hypothetical protein